MDKKKKVKVIINSKPSNLMECGANKNYCNENPKGGKR